MPGTSNRLLHALRDEDRRAVTERAQRVRLSRGDLLIDIGAPLSHVWFPEGAVVSAVAAYENGDIMEMATVGREGCTGIEPLLGADRVVVRYLAQVDGEALMLPTAMFHEIVATRWRFESMLRGYALAFMYQLMISSACNGSHSLEERLSRWLLNMDDRSDLSAMPLTHEFLAEMLGVQRPSLSKAAKALQDRRLISYGRGAVEIRNRKGLERASCECYRQVKNAYKSLIVSTA